MKQDYLKEDRMTWMGFRINGVVVSLASSGVLQNSLGVLMERMLQSQPVFVRCIKPNVKKAADLFEDDHVEAQVRASQ